MDSTQAKRLAPPRDEADAQWYFTRKLQLQHRLVEAVGILEDCDLLEPQTRALVKINIADVVHERIGEDTVRIELTDKGGCGVGSLGTSEPIVDLRQISSAIELDVCDGIDAFDFDEYLDFPRTGVKPAPSAVAVRQFLFRQVATFDWVAVIRVAMLYRALPNEACSAARPPH